jgi:hypothetical protein
MSSERTEKFSQPPVSKGQQTSDVSRNVETAGNHGPPDDDARHEATVLVRGETIRDQESKSPPKDKEAAPKEVSETKVKMQTRLPVLDDDPDVGIQKEQTIVRDGKPDLSFAGKLLASAAPPSALNGRWQEYRIYETNGGKHVFSKATRSVFASERDTHEAEIFDPSPSSVPSQLLRSARELTRSHPLTWMDAAASFFGYDPLAKALYRKLGGQFEDRIT